MSLLAFDPERVGWIHAAMQRAIGDLDAIRLSDPLAGSERQRIRSTRAALDERWLPLTTRLLSCSAMTDAPPPPDLTVATIGVVAMVQLGWQTATDTLDASTVPPIPTAAELALLAQLFSTFEITDLLATADDVRTLAVRLAAIAMAPGAAAALRASLGWDDTEAIATLADERWAAARDLAADPEDGELAARVAALDQALAALVDIIAGPLAPPARSAWLRTTTEQLDPYAAALVVRALAPHGEELGELSASILGRWLEPDPETGEWVDRLPATGHGRTPTTGDLLLPLVADDIVASRSFARAAAGDPRLLFETTDDPAIPITILSTATDPETTSTWAVGELLRPILDWLQQAEPWRVAGMVGDFAARPVMAAVIAPWLLQFHSLADEWAWTTEEGDGVLEFLVDEAAAADVLLQSAGHLLDLATSAPVRADGAVDLTIVDAVAMTLDALYRLVAADAIDDARFARTFTDPLIGWATKLATAVVAAVPVVGEAAAAGTPFALDALTGWLRDRGVLPPDEATAGAESDARYDERSLWTATVAVSATVASLVDAGALPAAAMDDLAATLDGDSAADECDARDLHHRLLDYVESMRDRADPAVVNALGAVVQSFLSGNHANGVCE